MIFPSRAAVRRWALRALVVFVPLFLGALGGRTLARPDPVRVEVERPAPPSDPCAALVHADGWFPDAAASDSEARGARFASFAHTPAGQVNELPKHVFLWNAERKLTGRAPPAKEQNPTGSCVGFGVTTAIERTLAADIAARRGDPSEFTHFSEEVTYAGSRVQGARLVGGTTPRGDGSTGVYAKAFVTQFGMVPKGKYGALDLTAYSAKRARDWNHTGCPKELEAVARKYPVRDGAKVTNWREFKAAVASGYGVAICANWSFSRERDANGVARPTREGWSHCMAADGYIVLDDGREFGHVENSWSDLPGVGPYHTGPTGWGEPSTAGFWTASDAIDRALRQGDSYAYSGATGFPARVLPPGWFIRGPLVAPRGFARVFQKEGWSW